MLSFNLIQNFLHLAFDIAFLILIILQMRVVIQRRQPQHLRWISPALASNVATTIYRLLTTMFYLVPRSETLYLDLLGRILLDLSNIAGIVSGAIFLQMLRKNLEFPWVYKPSTGEDQDTWPPAPQDNGA